MYKIQENKVLRQIANNEISELLDSKNNMFYTGIFIYLWFKFCSAVDKQSYSVKTFDSNHPGAQP